MGFQQGFRINTNTASLNTYRSYGSAQAGLERNIERLSSGMRINRAADDSAGLASSQRRSNLVRGRQLAKRNARLPNSGWLRAEGGLDQISNILGRMRELAVQSASDGVNADDRASIDLEYQQLKAEITRIGDATEYNGTKLINGHKAKGLDTSGSNSDAIVSGGISSDAYVASTAKDGEYTFTYDSSKPNELKLELDTNTTQTITFADGFSAGDEVHFDELGISVKLAIDFDPTATTLNAKKLKVDQGEFYTIQVGSNNDASADANTFSSGANATENRITFNIGDATADGLGLDGSDLTALGNSQHAINELDAAIAKVNDERSNIGALQNRFEYTSSNLMNSIQNNAASLSTIRDADFAVEAADLARNQILTQSSSAMLAQANSLSQNVLGLIR
jgi:flagellin